MKHLMGLFSAAAFIFYFAVIFGVAYVSFHFIAKFW